MVPGLDAFRDWFEGFHGRHVIIGGTACNLIYASYGAPERATKDIDLVILADAFNREYFNRFVEFVEAGGYQHRTKDGRYELYRFERPADNAFPPKLELLSRRPEVLRGIETALGRLQTTDGPYSLSAILLDDDYYQLLEEGVETIDGLPVLGLHYLPVFKMHAWCNLSRDRQSGLNVHSDEINKHRSDVCKLCSLITPGTTVELAPSIREEITRFVEAQPWDDNMLRSWSLPINSEDMASVIRSIYLPEKTHARRGTQDS